MPANGRVAALLYDSRYARTIPGPSENARGVSIVCSVLPSLAMKRPRGGAFASYQLGSAGKSALENARSGAVTPAS